MELATLGVFLKEAHPLSSTSGRHLFWGTPGSKGIIACSDFFIVFLNFNISKYNVKTSLFISLFILRDPSPSRRSLGSYAVGEILLYLYVPMFPWKDF
jgi:hypothetical protein